MMLHGSQSPTPSLTPHQSPVAPPPPATANANTTNFNPTTPRKRKADSQDNERLTKRLSLLNIEQNGSKLYVPVETPSSSSRDNVPVSRPNATAANSERDDDMMRLDDTKHKVYIYDIDDELTSEDDDDNQSDDGKLVFLPDIEKHLRANRIPPHILANSDGELAGMQMVLYSDPKSLSVPEDKDSVRKAIIDARQRLRDRQGHEGGQSSSTSTTTSVHSAPDTSTAKMANGVDGGMAMDSGPPDSPEAMDMD